MPLIFLFYRDLAGFTILPGSTSITSGTAVPVEKIILHRFYTGSMPLYHDIAIVHVSQFR